MEYGGHQSAGSADIDHLFGLHSTAEVGRLRHSSWTPSASLQVTEEASGNFLGASLISGGHHAAMQVGFQVM